MATLIIRKATPADAAYIALLARVTFTETFGHYFHHAQDLRDYYDRTFSVAKLRASLQKENNVFWLALADDLPVGYAKLKKYSPSAFAPETDASQLQKIYVLRDFLGQKIGVQLQQALLDECQIIGSNYVWLSVLNNNERAIAFYEQSDFAQIGTHTFEIGRAHFDFLVLGKSLV